MPKAIRRILCAAAVLLFSFPAHAEQAAAGQIIVGRHATETEHYAARELQRYLYQLTGSFLPVNSDSSAIDRPTFVVGTTESNTRIAQFAAEGKIVLQPDDPGPQGYLLKRISAGGNDAIVIAGGTAIGSLYGVYGLLDDYYRVAFYPSGDVLPEKKSPLLLPAVDETRTPKMYIRGVLPWTNFHQSATVYSWADWKFVLDQMARMRLNFIHIHNYNKTQGHYPVSYTENNEMFHSFSYRGFRQRAWFSTASSGHCWTVQGWDVNKYRFGAADLFADYDFGSDCTLHNETLSNDAVFRKGASMFQKVIAYAHTRGIRVGLGLDIDLIPKDYGAEADDPEIIQSRLDQIIEDYPDLDYLLCFQSEKHSAWSSDEYKHWRRIFDQLYTGIKKRSKHIRIAVSGWGLNPESIQELPADVICAPIARYGAKFESGSIYGDREYWGCPWLETDGGCSQHYYPYNVHLSDTMESYAERAPNMKGFYCLTWRISDAIEPKLSYIAKAPWDTQNRYACSRDIYKEYAERNYGSRVAEEITAIINENEAFAEDHGECRHTPLFTGSDRKAVQGRILETGLLSLYDTTGKTEANLPLSRLDGKYGTTITTGSSAPEGACLKNIACGNWVQYNDVEWHGGMVEAGIRARVFADSEIELRLDRPDGRKIGVIEAAKSGDWQELRTAISAPRGKHALYLRFLLKEKNDADKAERQLSVIDEAMAATDDPGQKYRLGLLRCRIAAVKAYLEIDQSFPAVEWNQLPGGFDVWMKNFTGRVYDISSLGNIISVQNRFVKQRYTAKIDALRQQQAVQAPSFVKAYGTRDGAVISWRNEEPRVSGFHIYRNGRRITDRPLPPEVTVFADKGNGQFEYTVSAVSRAGEESVPSIPGRCAAGTADQTGPQIVVISPPTSGAPGRAADISARILDGRTFSSISATLHYKNPDEKTWRQVPMRRRTKAVFGIRIPGDEITEAGLEYYITGFDGDHRSRFPAGAPSRSLHLTAYPVADTTVPPAPEQLHTKDKTLRWSNGPGDAFWYQIYRSRQKNFKPGPENRVTFIPAVLTEFRDNGLDWDGTRLNGFRYYIITAMDKDGNESAASSPAAIEW